ncbi:MULTISPECIES: hypothetical protein [Dickeya]|uniref:hypothetical protein n=1 Tax=Dickeya TaxID=204037 RepID=UPI001180C5D6|nr:MULTISPECIES: hypothetical protein [Dickeya]TYL41602.1 hypothetical protein FDP13_17285 [Dickeya sp. ws52]UPT56434.1 hypothetical protein FGI00_13125 [Dickeya zeae]
MSDKTEYFSKYFEIEDRKSFSSEQEISPENFKALVGYYELDGNVSCQVKTKRGFCRKNHKIGWLGVTVDGVEALIGGHCAKTYFKADMRFSLEKKRITSELDRRRYISELQPYHDNIEAFITELDKLKTNLINVRKVLSIIYNTMPDIVLRFIETAQRTNNWELNVDVLYPAKNEEQRPQWQVHTLSTLKSISTLREIISLIARVKILAEKFSNFREADLYDLPTPKLKYYANEFREKLDYERLSLILTNETKKFIDPKNLYLLLFVCDEYEDKFTTVKSVFGITGSKVQSDAHVNLRIRKIEERISKMFNNYPVRANKQVVKYKNNDLV